MSKKLRSLSFDKILEDYVLFSETEKRALELLDGERVRIADLALGLYGASEPEAGNKTAAVMRRIARKCVYFKLKWTITGEGTGRHGRTVWRTKQPRSK